MRLFAKTTKHALMALVFCLCAPALAEDEVMGPPNMLKTVPTPFSSAPKAAGVESPEEIIEAISPTRRTLAGRLRLTEKTFPPRLFLPGRMVLGRSEEFAVKGKPGHWVAIAMADKNAGAKDIAGHKVRLGPDRKLVALARIPETGVTTVFIETPVQGDMIGQNFYFEAVTWSKDNFSDLEVAETVSPELVEGADNGVLVSAEPNAKRGLKFGANTALPPSQHAPAGTLDSGKP